LESPRRCSAASVADSGAGAATPSTTSLLRLLGELVEEYLTEEGGDVHDMHAADASAGAAVDTSLGIAVARLCVAEIVGMINRYASTEVRQSRLAQLGTLRPLACLLRGASDPLVLRCALETLVHFTMRRSAAVLAELVHLSLREDPPRACAVGAVATGLLRECLNLLACREEMYEGLAAQLLEQLLEAPELRAQLRRLRAIPTVLGCLRADSPEHCEVDEAVTVAASQGAGSKKAVHVLRCCQKLARDHVELGDPMAVQELLEHDALSAILRLLRRCQHDPRETESLCAALETLAQMCMDDECASALRLQHADGFAAVGSLLLDEPWRQHSDRALVCGASPDTDARRSKVQGDSSLPWSGIGRPSSMSSLPKPWRPLSISGTTSGR